MEKKAEYQISSSIHQDILELVLTGEETAGGSEQMKSDIDGIILKENIKNVIVDVRALKGRLSVIDTYQRVRTYDPDIRKFHLALVDLPENEEYQRFHETTAINAGLRFKFFTDIEKAKAWLTIK